MRPVLLALVLAAVLAPAAPAGTGPVVTAVAVGDIASCTSLADAITADLVREIDPDVILALGDLAYPDGSSQSFSECYDPTWGAFGELTRPAPGNHEYVTPAAAGYFAYFGDRAPAPYYSFELGRWHIVSLNSELPAGPGSAQERWLRRDLARDRRRCELVYFHRPRLSGGTHGSSAAVDALWRAAYAGGADLVLAGHDHNYQRFARLDDDLEPDRRHGMISVVAGTGGKSHYGIGEAPHRRAANGDTFGVVKLRLGPGGFSLRFVPIPGGSFTDRVKSATCHAKPRRAR